MEGVEWSLVPPPKHFLPNQKGVTKDSKGAKVSSLFSLLIKASLFLLLLLLLLQLFFFLFSLWESRRQTDPSMENSPKPLERQNTSLIPSPNSHSTNSSSSSSSNSNGLHHPPTPKPITRSESNPYPTTFVQADTSSFKQVVQMLTGSSETAKQASASKPASDPRNHIPPIKTGAKKQPGFKLYERRNSLKNLKLSPLVPGFVQNNSGFSPRKPEILSPSMLDFPALVLSPVTPLIPDPFNRSPMNSCSSSASANANLDSEAEEKAIAEKGFFLHPSPATTPRDSEPRLLSLFPVTSPRVPGSSTSS